VGEATAESFLPRLGCRNTAFRQRSQPAITVCPAQSESPDSFFRFPSLVLLVAPVSGWLKEPHFYRKCDNFGTPYVVAAKRFPDHPTDFIHTLAAVRPGLSVVAARFSWNNRCTSTLPPVLSGDSCLLLHSGKGSEMYRIRISVFCCATLLLGTSLAAQGVPETRNQNNRATENVLETKVLTVDLNEQRLGDVLEYLQAESGLTFVLHDSANDNDLDRETPITLEMANTRLATVLSFLLDEYECTWRIEDGVVELISEDAALQSEFQSVRVFDCGDLLQQIHPMTVKRVAGVFGGSGSPPRAPLLEETISASQQLTHLITKTVDPASWEENGGEASMVSFRGVLVVRQTSQNLTRISNLLEQLRATGLARQAAEEHPG
jgi:hypothetical protein